MSKRSFQVFMLVLALAIFALSLGFWSVGAWPVLGFLGLDLLLVWLAFRMNYRSARQFEEIAVWPHDLIVRQISARGIVAEHRFNPFWTRFVVSRDEESGIASMQLAGEGRALQIGAFLNPDDRESFAAAFGQALAGVKRGLPAEFRG